MYVKKKYLNLLLFYSCLNKLMVLAAMAIKVAREHKLVHNKLHFTLKSKKVN